MNELNKLVQKTKELVAKQSLKVKAQFVKITKEKIELNMALIEKRRLLLGIKGYCTDLSEKQLSTELVIDRSWHYFFTDFREQERLINATSCKTDQCLS